MRAVHLSYQRGVAAVEFALVLPTFLLILGAMVSLGSAYWTEFVMLDITSSSARACVLQQQPATGSPSDSGPAVAACAASTLQSLAATFPKLCPGGMMLQTPQIVPVNGGFVPSAPNNKIQLVQVTATCNMPFFFARPGSSFSFPVVAHSTMPFMN